MLGPNIALSVFSSTLGPIDNIQQSYFRGAIGWNDLAEARLLEYTQNWNAVLPAPGVAVGVGAITAMPNRSAYQPIRLTVQQAIQRWNQADFANGGAAALAQAQDNLRTDLQYAGVDLSAYGWTSLVDMSSTPASLDAALVNSYRQSVGSDAPNPAAQSELAFHLRRAGVRRQADQDLVTRPFMRWPWQDVQRLWWIGGMDPGEYTALMNAAGVVQTNDVVNAEWLGQEYPPPAELAAWDTRNMYNGPGVGLLGLDAAGDTYGTGRLYSGLQGVGVKQRLPSGAAEDLPDWYTMLRRSSRPVFGFSECLEMQWRLRDDGMGAGQSIVAGVPTWTPGITQACLELQGYSPTQIQWMMGLAVQPINIRIVHEVLLETLKRPALAAQAQAAFPAGIDWAASVFLDHGFAPPVASLAAAAIRAQAEDSANEEMIASQRRLRESKRATALAAYKVGVLSEVQTQTVIQDRFFGPFEAVDAIAIVQQEVLTGIAERQLASLKTAWFAGKVNAAQAAAVLAGVGFIPDRINQYLTEWAWERTENLITLSTADILAALRAGQMDAATAALRLVNLGWSAPDALVELAVVESAAATAAAHSAAAQQAAQAKQAASLARETSRATAASVKAAAKTAAETAKQGVLSVEGVHRRLMDTSEYFAKIHAANSAYRTAAKAGDSEKMQGELNKEIALYQKYLLQQQALVDQGPEVANAILPIDTTVAPGPGPSAPAGPAAGGYPPPPASP